MLAPEAVIRRLRLLKGVKPPLWLSGDVAVDFLVGRWTRRHGDIDLIAFHDRPLVTTALAEIGVELAKDGYWTTKWSFHGTQPADIEVVFVEPAESQTGVLVIPVDDRDRGRAGRYPFIVGYLDDEAWRELDGVPNWDRRGHGACRGWIGKPRQPTLLLLQAGGSENARRADPLARVNV